jgi:glycosyltransferase involved in cell wall biosynthesis
MRIVHVTDCYLPRIGGIELHVRDLAQRQRRDGHEVTIVTSTPGESLPGVLRVSVTDRDWLRVLEPDVVQAHVSIVSPLALTSARRAADQGRPTVVTIHSLWTHVGPLPQVARDLWGMRQWPVLWSAVSEQAAAPVRSLLGVTVHVVPNAVDIEQWTPLSQQPASSHLQVLSVMRLTGVKRALPLLDVLRRAGGAVDFRATVVGDGPRRAAMERYLDHHGLGERVRLAGTLDRDAIRQQLAQAAVFVAPAHRESFGIAALEARASGVPVIAREQSGVASFIRHGREGLLARDDREMVDHLVLVLRDHDLRARLTAHNRTVPPRLGWADALDRHARLYARASVDVRTRAPLAVA